MERFSSQRENPAGEYSGVRDREGGLEASGVAENPGGDRQGLGGVVKLPRVTNTLGVEELLLGYETFGVTLEGNGMPGTDRRGQRGERQHQPQRGNGERAGAGGAAEPIAGHVIGRERRGETAQAS